MYKNSISKSSIIFLGYLLVTTVAVSQEPDFSTQQIEFFENKIRPILTGHCLECHGADAAKLRGGLKLTSRTEILVGGDSGPAAIAGNPDESLLIQSVHYDGYEMPPTGQLTNEQIESLTHWVEMGLPDPRGQSDLKIQKAPSVAQGRSFWSFQPPKKSMVSKRNEDSWSRTEIDRFITQKWQENSLTPVEDADRTTLVRRIFLTLTGLPPTIEQIDKFVFDKRATSTVVDALVEELLDSPRFGERWGRHWLDIARFAESSGGGRSLMFPNAWRYRDYVIDAFNDDKPFDDFIREQIAGDLLTHDSFEQRKQRLIATGFLALGPTNYEQQDKELLRMEVIDEQVDTVGRTFLGMTLGCARCHDHKFDPIPMTDYYALAGIFGSTRTLVDGNVSRFVEQTISTEREVLADKQYREKISRLSKQLAKAKKSADKLQSSKTTSNTKQKSVDAEDLPGIVLDDSVAQKIGTWQDSTSVGLYVERGYIHDKDESKGEKKVVFKPEFAVGGRYQVRMSFSAGGNRASNVPVTIDHQDGKTTILVNQSQKPAIQGLFVSLGTFRFEADNLSAVSISNMGTDGHVIVDAIQFLPEHEAKIEQENDALEIANRPNARQSDKTGEQNPQLRSLYKEIARLDALLRKEKSVKRKPLAKAMSVMDVEKPADGHVHIRGEVRNLGDVVPRGVLSVASAAESLPIEIPTYSSGRLELAEWIASADNPLTARVYVNRVWRHLFGKGLVPTPDNFGAMGFAPTHRRLLDYLAKDFVENGWSTKHLIKKIMASRVWQLSANYSGQAFAIDEENRWYWRYDRRRLDAEVIRDSILATSGNLDLTVGGLTIRKISQYDLGYKFESVRRSVYVPAFRNSMLALFEVFDFANPNLVVGDRNTSTLPTQALYLMNSRFVMEQSRSAAKKLLKKNLSLGERIEVAFRTFLGRHPTAMEIADSKRYLRTAVDELKTEPLAAWANFCHALYASLDFRYMN